MSTYPAYQRFFAELKRRHVFRVVAVYGVVGFLILQVVDLAVPALLLPEWTYRMVALVLLVGFPVAAVLAWAFETTPDGVRRTAEVAPEEIRAILDAPASKRWPAGLMAVGGMVALLAGAWYVGLQSAPAAASATGGPGAVGGPDGAGDPVTASIAVLPFVNMSSDVEQEYFSDGLSEELLNLLAKIPELRVAARTSSFSFRDRNVEIPEIGRRLNVAHVLEGSVRKSGDRVRITAQLIRTGDGFHEWSHEWDRTLDDIFAIQEEIARDVTERLRVTLLGATPAVKTADPVAYAAYLQARHLGRQGSPEALAKADSLYRLALSIDSTYADAFTGLAWNTVSWVLTGDPSISVEDRMGEGRRLAERALALDPENAGAHAALGRLAGGFSNNTAAALAHVQRAVELEPTNLDVLFAAGNLLRDLARYDEALEVLRYVNARDPVNPAGFVLLGYNLIGLESWDEAIEAFRTALSLNPDYSGAHYWLSFSLLMKGDAEAALAAAAAERTDEEYRTKAMALAFHALGRTAEHEAAFAELRERWGARWPSEVAHVYAWKGQADAAFEWLDRAVAQDEDGLAQQFDSPYFRPIHADLRWRRFLERTGTAPEQLAALEFEVKLPG